MSTIRDGILALLTQGPAYGLQLRNELDARLKRSHSTNVGQVYATLERLQAAGLIIQHSHTTDGLPLYALTDDGEREATEWMRTPRFDSANRWESMVAQVMIVRSFPGVSSEELVAAARQYWEVALQSAQEQYSPELSADLRSSAEESLAIAALGWLQRVAETDDSGTPISQTRPPRGRPALARP